MYTIQYSPEAVRYMQQVFPWAYQNHRRKRHLDRYSCFCSCSLGDRPTDHATRSVTIVGAHSGEAKFCYCLRLLGVSLGPPASSTQTASRSLQPFLQASLGDRPTDRPTDHATRSVKVGRAHSGEAEFCYCLRLQQVTTSIYWSSRQIHNACLFFVSVHQMAPFLN